MNKSQLNRRRFIQRSLACAAGASPLMAMLSSLGQLEAAETGGDYKAIVCVLLEGGADVFNMIVPTEQNAYNQYKEAREGFGLKHEDLLSFTHDNLNQLNPITYGMRNNMTRMQGLFEEKKLSIIANVGTLVEPVTRQMIEGYQANLPTQLFSHYTQRLLWMLGNASKIERNGWAARAGNLFYPTSSSNPYFNVTVGGKNSLQLGGNVTAIEFEDAYISTNTMVANGFGAESGGGALGAVYKALYEGKQNADNKLMSAFSKRRVNELNQHADLNGLFDSVESFYGFAGGENDFAKQLELVAQILSVKNAFPGQRKRQVFFVNHRGWDTHDGDNARQVGDLDQYLGAFQDAVGQLGLENNVTTFTISDFGRSLTSNGTGTDHGWGGHAFVMGGAVNGGDIYGKMPQLVLDSPDAWSDRMIPTTAMEEYLATIVKWFGATDAELNTIFPNLSTFTTNDMGFMG